MEAATLRVNLTCGYSLRYVRLQAHELPECPVFRPTADEFADPGKYIRSIMPQVNVTGM